MTEMIRESTQAFEEFIALNGLNVETHLAQDVTIQMHPVLADILWTNLFQNAIKHNVDEGSINITLTQNSLTIANTGESPEISPKELFARFKKGDSTSNSIGLGLSIIKRIVDQNNYTISYEFEGGWHTIVVEFKN
jgi:signal transduction histidine kinase